MNRLEIHSTIKKKLDVFVQKKKSPILYFMVYWGLEKDIYCVILFIIFINPKKKLKNTSCILIAHIVKELNLFEMN